MQNFSYHTHTNSFGCYDGHNTIEEMINAARTKGFCELGISNHLIYHPNIYNGCEQAKNDKMYHADFNKAQDIFKRTIDKIKEVADKEKFKVYAGFEVDFFPSLKWRDSFEKIITEVKPDYLIGSTHFIRTSDETKMCNIYYIKSLEAADDEKEEMLKNYWQNIIEAIKSGYFDFIAHLDVCKLFNLCCEEKWNYWKEKVIETLDEYKQPYELNTSGWTKIGEQHPHTWMLKELSYRKVPVVISDDAHRIEHVGQHFEQAEELLKDLNYKTRWKLNK